MAVQQERGGKKKKERDFNPLVTFKKRKKK